MASTYLTYTPSSAKTSDYKATLSFWVKRTELDGGTNFHGILSSNTGFNSGNGYGIGFYEDNLVWYKMDSSTSNNRTSTARKFRDCSGYYHIVYKIDTTEASANDRIKLYVNGVYDGAFTTNADKIPAQNTAPYEFFENGDVQCIGSGQGGGGTYSGMILSHFYFIDGLAYEPTVFGSTDADSGEWKINTSPSVTYGNNGFLILKDGNTITDQGSNSNDWTVGGGTLTDLQDCPDDVFATMNPLAYPNIAGGTYSNGNNTWVTGNTYYTYTPATLAVTKGKFYWEVEYVAKSGGNIEAIIGITSTQATTTTNALGSYPNDWGYHTQNVTSYYLNNDVYTAYGTAYTEGDIIGVALDADNNKLYFSKNGTWQNSGDPESGSTGTGALAITAPGSTPLGAYFPSVTFYAGGNNGTFNANFGNGLFATTAISSEGTNASGIGKFEYDVPAGYTALSTKGLNV